MASINDLRTGPNTTGEGTGTGTEDGGVINFGSVNVSSTRQVKKDESVQKESSNDVMDLGNVNTRKIKTSDDDFTPPKRKIADISSLPQRELQGVDIKESIEAEVFKEGGEFESVVNRKIKEFQEVNDLIDQHNAQVAAELGRDIPTDEELEEIGQIDMTPALIGTKYYDQADNFGRARNKMKSSPLEQRAAKEGKTVEQYLSGQDASPTAEIITDKEGNAVAVEDKTESTMYNLEEEEEYMDELEKEINEEIGTIDDQIEIIDGSTEESSEIEESVDEIESIEEVTEEEIVKETPKEEAKTEKEEDSVPVIEVASPTVIEEQKEQTAHDKLEDAVKDPNIGVNVDMHIDEEDIDIELEGDDEDMSTSNIEVVNEDENMKEFQASISEKIKPVTKALNLSSFKVVNQPVSLSAALTETKRAAMSWALPNSNQYIAMSEFSGKEIEQLGDTSGTNRYETMKNRYKLFYDHIVSPKPATLEQWLKTISFLDNDHLFFAVYGANFAGSNYIPYDCPQCRNTFLSENISLEDMYKFKDDESKEKFNRIRNSQESMPTGLYVSEVVQISDKIAIGFRDPSIYTIVFETAMLDDNFTDKYRDIIAVVSYIDNIYLINPDTQSLAPIGYKVDKNNAVKTIKARIITYAKILAKLAPDQYYIILSYLNAINSKGDEITYIKPEVTCPNCNTVISEQVVTAESLVFTRAQLASLSATSLN